MTASWLKRLMLIVGAVLVVMALLTAELRMFSREENGHDQTTNTAQAGPADYVAVEASVVGVDPVAGRMTVQLGFVPHGRFDAGGGLLAVPIEVDVSDVGGDALEFPAHRRMFSHEVALALDGDVANYPWDRHRARLELLLTAKAGSEGEEQAVPVRLDFAAHRHGYVFRDRALPDGAHGYLGFEVTLLRSPLVIWPAVFCMAIMWGLTIINGFLLWAVLRGRMEVDLTLFGYMSGLIVALYFFREVLPDVPPFLGVLADYAAFFWAEFITTLISLIFAAVWFRRMVVASRAAEKG